MDEEALQQQQLLGKPPSLPGLDPTSRPSSTSTQASAALPPPQQLPGISSLQAAAAASVATSQQLIASKSPFHPPSNYARTSPASTAGPGGNLPTCQNCATSTTPLWRRDEMGSVLCNACGLFLKLHGRPRPISLKTDVIKSRNRVKTARGDLPKQKKAPAFPPVSDVPGADNTVANMPTGTPGIGARRPSGRSANGHADDQSPISRTATPNMNYMMYPDMDGTQFQSQSGIAFATPTGADGRVMADLNGEHPPTQETLLAENASLKTRVSELEVIQELYRGRLQQLEQDEANARQTHELSKQTEAQLHSQLEGATQTETQLRNELEESHRRENMLKRRLDEMELELKQAKESSENLENGRSHKKPRVDDVVEDLKSENADTPQSAS